MDAPGRGQAAAIPDRKNVGIPGCLQRRLDDELIDAICLEPVEPLQDLRRFDAGCPYDQLGGDEGAVGEFQSLGGDFLHPGAGSDLDAHLVEQAVRRLRDAFRQSRKDTRRSLDQDDANIALRVDAVEPRANDFVDRAKQLGGQFRTGRAGADDRDVKLTWAHRLRLRLRAEARVEQTTVEAFRLSRRLQGYGMFGDARRPEIVGHAADCDHQGVITDRAFRSDLPTLVVVSRGEAHLLAGAIQADHLAETITKSVPMRLGEVAHFVFAGIEAACRHSVQQWLPEMGPGTFDQSDGRPRAPAQAIAEPGNQLNARRPAANDDDAVQRLRARAFPGARRGTLGTHISVVCPLIGLTIDHLLHPPYSE